MKIDLHCWNVKRISQKKIEEAKEKTKKAMTAKEYKKLQALYRKILREW